jgi:hypothetical protein
MLLGFYANFSIDRNNYVSRGGFDELSFAKHPPCNDHRRAQALRNNHRKTGMRAALCNHPGILPRVNDVEPDHDAMNLKNCIVARPA